MPKKASKEPFPGPKKGLPDGLTSEWMTNALRAHDFISEATSVRISRVGDIYNLNGKVFRVEVTYHGKEVGMPTSFVLKMAPNNPAGARREVLFYNSLLSKIPFGDKLVAPRCYWAATDVVYRCEWSPDGPVEVPGDETPAPSRPGTADSSCTAMIMDDVGEHDLPTVCGFGRADFESWHHGNILFEDAKHIVQRLAVIHAAYWGGEGLSKFEPLKMRRQYFREGPPLWELLADKWPRVSSLFQPFALLKKHFSDFETVKKTALGAPVTLQHGDLAPPNFRVEGETVFFFDWAEVNVGSAGEELANFVDRCNFYSKELALLHGKAFQLPSRAGPVATSWSEPVVRELLQKYHKALTHAGIEYPLAKLVNDFVLSSLLLNLEEVVEIEGKDLSAHIAEIEQRLERVLVMLEALAAQYLK